MRGEDLSTSEDEDGNKKSGYELTEYMKEYNQNTRTDFTKGYEPKKLDEDYKNLKGFDSVTTCFPMVYTEPDTKHQTVQISNEIKAELAEMFSKLQSNTYEEGKVRPSEVI